MWVVQELRIIPAWYILSIWGVKAAPAGIRTQRLLLTVEAFYRLSYGGCVTDAHPSAPFHMYLGMYVYT
jgi:hypothetical protein